MSKVSAAAMLAIVFALPLPAYGISQLERMILEEIACDRNPRPTSILRELARIEKIDVSENVGYDSMSCWKIDGGIDVVGMRFVSICGFEEDAGIRERNTDLYYRGPGTSPGQMLSLGSDVSSDELAEWYFRTFGPRLINSAISDGER